MLQAAVAETSAMGCAASVNVGMIDYKKVSKPISKKPRKSPRKVSDINMDFGLDVLPSELSFQWKKPRLPVIQEDESETLPGSLNGDLVCESISANDCKLPGH